MNQRLSNKSSFSMSPPAAGANGMNLLLIAALVFLIAWILALASVPPVDRDALTHHLAIPKLYLKAGGMYEIPEIAFSYYPMNLDLLYLIPLYFGNDIVPKYIHFAFGLLTAWLIYGFLRNRTGGRFWGLLGALMFVSLPVIVKLSITVYVDLGLVFFSTAALLQLIKWASSGYRLRHLCMAGISCGLCLGTKYNGLITFFLLTCSVPILYLRGRVFPGGNSTSGDRVGAIEGGKKKRKTTSMRALGTAFVFAALSLAVYSPWMVRNYAWTGNPLYPLYQSAVGKFHPPPPARRSALRRIENTTEKPAAALNHFVVRKRIFNESLPETLAIPIRIFFQGRDDDPKFFDGRLNPYLLIFPFLAFMGFGRLSRHERLENATLAGFAVLFLMIAFFKVDMRIRYVAPIIPPLVILSAAGLHRGWTLAGGMTSGAARKTCFALLTVTPVFLLTLNGLYAYRQLDAVDALSYLRGQKNRDAYIAGFRDEYPALQYINSHLPVDATVLSLYLGNRIYYSDRKMFCGDAFFVGALKSSDTAEQLKAVLRSRGFSHLLIRADFFERFLLAFLDPDGRRRIVSFLEHQATLLYDDGHYRVMALTGQLPAEAE